MHSIDSTAPNRDVRQLSLILGLGVVAFLVLLRLFWVGFIGADDELYWRGAGGWLSQFPYLGTNHWTLRHTLVLPIAAARLVFGNSMLAMALPTVLYAVALIGILGFWTWSSLGGRAAALAVSLLITDPQLVLWASTADVDIPEIFFIIAAFFALDLAMARLARRPHRISTNSSWGLLILSGALIGLAILSRETAVFAVATVGILFLAGYGMSRLWYFVAGAGCVLVLGLETTALWRATGSWLYRANIDVNHDHTINRWLDQGASIPFVHPLIDPVTMFLLNHNFGLITWMGVPLVIWLFAKRALSGRAKREAVLLATLALVWTLLSAGAWKLLPLTPRYYLLPSIIVCVLSGMALATLWALGHRKLTVALTMLFLTGNVFALAIDNRTYMFGVTTLVETASRQNETIHTDPQTSRRANLLLEWAGTRDKVARSLPRSGELFFYNPSMADASVAPGKEWTIVERYPVPDSGARWLACHVPTGLAPKAMVDKFKCGNNAVILYRVS